jgi:hypothetical protein
MAIPATTDELTPAWFSEVLDGDVTGVERLDAHSGTTGRAVVRLTSDDDVPDTVFVKLQPFTPERREFLRMVGLGVAEAKLYAAVGNDLPVRSPHCWHADFDDADGSFVMVLEDLAAAGCRFPTADDEHILEIAESLMDELAVLHAAFWDQELPWLGRHALSGGVADDDEQRALMAGGAALVEMAVDQFAADLPPAFTELARTYADCYLDIAVLWDQGTKTLIHADDHVGNLFVDRGRSGFFDWAVASRFPGMRDVAYFLCNSLPPEVRRAEERALLTRYLKRLADNGISLDRDLAEAQYRLFAVYAWLSATTTSAMGSELQPIEVGKAAMARTTEAVIDLEVLDFLRDRLG